MTVATSHFFLYSEQYDFEPYLFAPTKIIGFLFVPRSGSTLLACLLAQTKAFGFPLEYFAPVNIAYLEKRFSGSRKDYLSNLFRIRTTKNGVFSYKLSSDMLSSKLDPTITPEYLIVVDRNDKLAQAKSLSKAVLTQEWVLQSGSESNTQKKTLTDQQIEYSLGVLQRYRNQIDTYVKSKNIKVAKFSFEQIIQEPQKTINDVFAFVNMKNIVNVDINKVPIAKQS